MASLYLLDTSVLSHLVRQPQGPVTDRIAEMGEANVVTSVRYGHRRVAGPLLHHDMAAAAANLGETVRAEYPAHVSAREHTPFTQPRSRPG